MGHRWTPISKLLFNRCPTGGKEAFLMAALVPELYCSDFSRSVELYCAVLGFRILYAWPEENFAFLDRNGAQLMLEQPTGRTWLTGPLERPYGAPSS